VQIIFPQIDVEERRVWVGSFVSGRCRLKKNISYLNIPNIYIRFNRWDQHLAYLCIMNACYDLGIRELTKM
jgi:hypothetical protein